MNKARLLLSVALPVVLGMALSGCSSRHTTDTSKQWTPAKSGMSREQFFAMAAKQMKGRGAPTQPATPQPNAAPGGAR